MQEVENKGSKNSALFLPSLPAASLGGRAVCSLRVGVITPVVMGVVSPEHLSAEVNEGLVDVGLGVERWVSDGYIICTLV
jgi:hypothetical protein